MNHKLLNAAQRQTLVLALTRHHQDLERVPQCVQKTLDMSIQSLKQGNPMPIPSELGSTVIL